MSAIIEALFALATCAAIIADVFYLRRAGERVRDTQPRLWRVLGPRVTFNFGLNRWSSNGNYRRLCDDTLNRIFDAKKRVEILYGVVMVLTVIGLNAFK